LAQLVQLLVELVELVELESDKLNALFEAGGDELLSSLEVDLVVKILTKFDFDKLNALLTNKRNGVLAFLLKIMLSVWLSFSLSSTLLT
jgi:hypothetical protein